MLLNQPQSKLGQLEHKRWRKMCASSHHHPPPPPTHAWPSLPVVQDTNPTPPNLGPLALHDTAATVPLIELNSVCQVAYLSLTSFEPFKTRLADPHFK